MKNTRTTFGEEGAEQECIGHSCNGVRQQKHEEHARVCQSYDTAVARERHTQEQCHDEDSYDEEEEVFEEPG